MQRTFSFLIVNAIISFLPFFVFPNKINRSSICECSVSLKALLCLSKNACSCSFSDTLCFTQLFALFPSSHSNVKISGKIMLFMYIRCSYILLFIFIFVKTEKAFLEVTEFIQPEVVEFVEEQYLGILRFLANQPF